MSKLNITRLMLGLCLAVYAVSATGCNTVEGAGKDTQKLGEKVSDTADRNK